MIWEDVTLNWYVGHEPDLFIELGSIDNCVWQRQIYTNRSKRLYWR